MYGTATIVGHDAYGLAYAFASDGTLYYPTPCCGASAKGLEDGVGCRACYRMIDPMLGGVPVIPATEGDVSFWTPDHPFGTVCTVERCLPDGTLDIAVREDQRHPAAGTTINVPAKEVRPWCRPSMARERSA